MVKYDVNGQGEVLGVEILSEDKTPYKVRVEVAKGKEADVLRARRGTAHQRGRWDPIYQLVGGQDKGNYLVLEFASVQDAKRACASIKRRYPGSIYACQKEEVVEVDILEDPVAASK